MIRQAIIVALTLAAVVTSALNWRSYSNTIRREFRLTSKVVLFVHLSNALEVLFNNGASCIFAGLHSVLQIRDRQFVQLERLNFMPGG